MSITHHPSDETLLRYAAGTLAPGPSLVVATHLAISPASDARLGRFEAFAGLALDDAPPAPLANDALARTLARLDTPPELAPAPARRPPDLPADILWPAPLDGVDFGRWRFLAPGIRWSAPDLPRRRNASLMLLRVAPGMKMPEHGHTGLEYTCVLAGAYADASGRFGPGDLQEEDADSDHQPVVEPGAECICLIAIEGRMRPKGLLARLMQPFLGM